MLNKQTDTDKKTPTKYSAGQTHMSACQGQDCGWFPPFLMVKRLHYVCITFTEIFLNLGFRALLVWTIPRAAPMPPLPSGSSCLGHLLCPRRGQLANTENTGKLLNKLRTRQLLRCWVPSPHPRQANGECPRLAASFSGNVLQRLSHLSTPHPFGQVRL